MWKTLRLFSHFRCCQHCRTGSIEAGAFRLGVPQRSILESLCSQWQDEIEWVRKLSCECLNISSCLRFVALKRLAKTSPVVLGAGTLNTGRICLYVAIRYQKWTIHIDKWLVGTPWRTIGCQLVSSKLISNSIDSGRVDMNTSSLQILRKTNNFLLLLFDALKMWTLESTEKQQVQKPQRESKTTQIRSLNKWFSPKCVHRQLLQNPYKSPYK